MCYSKRSTLYGIKPEGEGSVYIESLTSYVVRLSEKHMVKTGDLVSHIIAPQLNKDYLLNSVSRGGNRFYDGAHFLNGFGSNAIDMVRCLEVLTGKNQLLETTLIKLETVLRTRHLIRKHLAWCPHCFKEKMYYPLVWCLSDYKVCIKHGVTLQENCSHCGKVIPYLHRKSKVGVCPYCNCSHCNSSSLENSPSRRNYYISRDIENVLSQRDKINTQNSNALQHNLLNIIEHKFEGKIDYLAKYIGIPKTTMWYWCKGKTFPPFRKVLELAYELDISATDLYTNVQVVYLNFEWKNNIQRVTKKREKKEFDKEKMLLHLKEISSQKDSINFINDIAKRFNCSTKYLYKHFSDYCRTISINNVASRVEMQKVYREEIYLRINEEFQKSFLHGELPIRKKVELELGMPYLFVNHEIKRYYFELCLKYQALLKGGRESNDE
ncbi:TPA: helix-turn-helix domain-containing protein [Bacillus thuringiensis]|nr:helix-turn-helix domain-containing protein [Bacillus thuringiensis]